MKDLHVLVFRSRVPLIRYERVMDLLDLDGIDRVFVQSRKVPIRHPACLPEPVLRTAPHAGFRALASRTLTGNRRLGTAKPVWPGHYSSAHETCPVPSLLHEYVDGATHTEPRYRFRAGVDLESCLPTLHSDPECDVARVLPAERFPTRSFTNRALCSIEAFWHGGCVAMSSLNPRQHINIHGQRQQAWSMWCSGRRLCGTSRWCGVQSAIARTAAAVSCCGERLI